jgi:hypothetical protein
MFSEIFNIFTNNSISVEAVRYPVGIYLQGCDIFQQTAQGQCFLIFSYLQGWWVGDHA